MRQISEDTYRRQVASSALLLREVAATRHLFGARIRIWKRGKCELVSKFNMADQRIKRRSNKKELLVMLMMLLDDEEYKHVERRRWVSRREERGAYYTIFLLHSILKGKNSNQFEFVRQIAVTKFCCSDKDFHMSNEAICCSNLSPPHVAAICRIVCLGLIVSLSVRILSSQRSYFNSFRFLCLCVFSRCHYCYYSTYMY